MPVDRNLAGLAGGKAHQPQAILGVSAEISEFSEQDAVIDIFTLLPE